MAYFAYLRESIDLKSGIEIQRQKIEAYCKYKNVEISKWFIDNDRSAYKYRPNYDKMMKLLLASTNGEQGVICTTLSRFGRSTIDVLTDYGKLKTANKEIVFTDSNIDSSTIEGKAMLGMLAVFNDFERDTIRERLESGKRYAQENGTKSGLPMNRPPVPIDWKVFDEYRNEKHLSIPSIAKFFGVSKKTMYTKIKARPTV